MDWPLQNPPFIWSANASGLAVRFASTKVFTKAKAGRAGETEHSGFRRMQILAECGQADVSGLEGGIFIATDDAVRLDAETRDDFALPPSWPGGMRLQTRSVPNLSDFSASLGVLDPGAAVVFDWKLRGPILEIGERSYLPTAAQFAALSAFQDWRSASIRDELTHLSLIATLREAHLAGCMIELEAYSEDGGSIIAYAGELVVNAREDRVTGDIILCPLPRGRFGELDVDDVEARIGQLDPAKARAVMRVGKTIVLLTETQTAQAKAIKSRGRVPKSERQAYERDPQQWLADHVFPDVSADFSPRVTGIGEWQGGYVGGALGEPEDWFGKQPEVEKPPRVPDPEPPIDPDPCEPSATVLVPLIIPNDAQLAYGWPFVAVEKNCEPKFQLNFQCYARQPMPHQDEAIRWMLGHSRRALEAQSVQPGQRGWGAGALLADDMGLGKTYSTLIFLAEWFRHWRESTKAEPPSVLIVAPLSLLENWKAEIEKTFHTEATPFRRVIIAQGDGDLDFFRRVPGARDVAEPGLVKSYGLGFGDGSERSLDWPGSCVLTTYQTLRDYRFSFAKCEWSVAVFDEAQYLKNPNAQQTIASKALRSLFRIALTGTPVENHLGDFWSILDTAEPGPLGAFADFRKRWIAPMNRERHRMADIGMELRKHVGGLMLRRTKDEQNIGLPTKTSLNIECLMSDEQQWLYEQAREAVSETDQSDVLNDKTQGRHLAALWHLRQISMHPDLVGGGRIASAKNAIESRRVLERSGKLAWLLQQLDAIKRDGEKVLIFCALKQLQEALSRHLQTIFDIMIPVINGDTKVGSAASSETRLGLIKEFSTRSGFGVCVLSPIAAGAGLNIVAANHVIHLERHWNPAKEDQATDRAYRIGATKPVTVYLPAATHPDFPSFDSILDKLLAKKRGLQSALGLIPPDAVGPPELIAEVFGNAQTAAHDQRRPITLQQALALSWKMFEALIAVIYDQDAERTILTPHGSDHGCDVVVLRLGAAKKNFLIQCKTTVNDELDSEEGVRAVEGSRPFFEKPLGLSFDTKILITTAKRFSRRTKRAAHTCSVELHGRPWLDEALKRRPVTMAEVLRREGSRERI